MLYQKTSLVYAEKKAEPFTIVDARTGAILQGVPGDYLVRNEPPTKIHNRVDEWIVPKELFEATYEVVNIEDIDLEPSDLSASADEVFDELEDPAFRVETPAKDEPGEPDPED